MDKDGLRELRDSGEDAPPEEFDSSSSNEGAWWRNNRTTVLAVGIRMRHEAKLKLSSGMVMEEATLVVVRPVQRRPEVEDDDWLLAAEAFGNEAVYAEAMERLLKSRNYILEMNSF